MLSLATSADARRLARPVDKASIPLTLKRSVQVSPSTPLEPKPDQPVQGGHVLFRLAVPEDAIYSVRIYAGPPSMRVTPDPKPEKPPWVSGGVAVCDANFDDDHVVSCLYETARPLQAGAHVWYAVLQHDVWDPARGEHSYPYSIEGPFPFKVKAAPAICRLRRQPGRLVVKPRIARVGETVTLTGSGFVPGYTVSIWPALAQGDGQQPRALPFDVIPREPVFLLGRFYSVQKRPAIAGKQFRVRFRLPTKFLLDASLPGRYWVFWAAQYGAECSRLPGYTTEGPLRTSAAVFLRNPAA